METEKNIVSLKWVDCLSFPTDHKNGKILKATRAIAVNESAIILGSGSGMIYFLDKYTADLKQQLDLDVCDSISLIRSQTCASGFHAVVVGTTRGALILLSLDAQYALKEKRVIQQHKSQIVDIAISSDLRRVASADSNGKVLLHSLTKTETFEGSKVLFQSDSSIVQLALNGSQLMISTFKFAIFVDLNDAEKTKRLGTKERNGYYGSTFSTIGETTYAFVARPNGNLWKVDCETGMVLTTLQFKSQNSGKKIRFGYLFQSEGVLISVAKECIAMIDLKTQRLLHLEHLRPEYMQHFEQETTPAFFTLDDSSRRSKSPRAIREGRLLYGIFQISASSNQDQDKNGADAQNQTLEIRRAKMLDPLGLFQFLLSQHSFKDLLQLVIKETSLHNLETLTPCLQKIFGSHANHIKLFSTDQEYQEIFGQFCGIVKELEQQQSKFEEDENQSIDQDTPMCDDSSLITPIETKEEVVRPQVVSMSLNLTEITEKEKHDDDVVAENVLEKRRKQTLKLEKLIRDRQIRKIQIENKKIRKMVIKMRGQYYTCNAVAKVRNFVALKLGNPMINHMNIKNQACLYWIFSNVSLHELDLLAMCHEDLNVKLIREIKSFKRLQFLHRNATTLFGKNDKLSFHFLQVDSVHHLEGLMEVAFNSYDRERFVHLDQNIKRLQLSIADFSL